MARIKVLWIIQPVHWKSHNQQKFHSFRCPILYLFPIFNRLLTQCIKRKDEVWLICGHKHFISHNNFFSSVQYAVIIKETVDANHYNSFSIRFFDEENSSHVCNVCSCADKSHSVWGTERANEKAAEKMSWVMGNQLFINVLMKIHFQWIKSN